MAVNCLVNEARRKSVPGPMGCFVRKSVTPYPPRNTGLPLYTISTAAPGASFDFSVLKIASTWPEPTCDGAASREEVHTRRKVANVVRRGRRELVNIPLTSIIPRKRDFEESFAIRLDSGDAFLQELDLTIVVGFVFADVKPLTVIVGGTPAPGVVHR